MPGPRLAGWQVAIAVAVVLLVYWELETLLRLSDGYRSLFDRFEYWVPRSLRSLLEVLLVLGAVCLLHRLGPGAGLRELGWRRPALPALGAMTAAVAPMWIVFGFAMPLDPEFSPPEVLYLALLSPLARRTTPRPDRFFEAHAAGACVSGRREAGSRVKGKPGPRPRRPCAPGT